MLGFCKANYISCNEHKKIVRHGEALWPRSTKTHKLKIHNNLNLLLRIILFAKHFSISFTCYTHTLKLL